MSGDEGGLPGELFAGVVRGEPDPGTVRPEGLASAEGP